MSKPKPHGHLLPATRRWWQSVVEQWDLEEHHMRVLTCAAESWDLMVAANALIRREGLTVDTKSGGPRAHPAVKIAGEARLHFLRAIRELDLDVDPPAVSKRPPGLRAFRLAGGAA